MQIEATASRDHSDFYSCLYKRANYIDQKLINEYVFFIFSFDQAQKC